MGQILQREPVGGAEGLFGAVFVIVFGVGAGVVAASFDYFGIVFLKCDGIVLEKIESADDVFVLGPVHVVMEFIGRLPALRFEAGIGVG